MEGWFALLAFAIAWLIAQVAKTVLGLLTGYRAGEITNFASAIGYFFRSGGMPSGHAASFTAMCTYLGCVFGFGSGIFALAGCTWALVIYDAINVRYAVGEQGKALNILLKEKKMPEIPLVEGHTLPQVIVGTIIGVVTGVIMFIFTKSLV